MHIMYDSDVVIGIGLYQIIDFSRDHCK